MNETVIWSHLYKYKYYLTKDIKDLVPDAAHIIKEDPYKKIAEGMWATFQLAYVEMVKSGDINAISEIGRDKALLYWTQACLLAPGEQKYRKIWIMQALYLYDLIAVKEPA